jgi:hypothetical protein
LFLSQTDVGGALENLAFQTTRFQRFGLFVVASTTQFSTLFPSPAPKKRRDAFASPAPPLFFKEAPIENRRFSGVTFIKIETF